MKWTVTRPYYGKIPNEIEASSVDDALEQLDLLAGKIDPYIHLNHDVMTDQIDSRFRSRNGKMRIFCTLMAGG